MVFKVSVWKKCGTCSEEMTGVRDTPDSCRDDCHKCGGKSLIEDTPRRIEARRNLAQIYGSMRNPPGLGGL